jgi:hypothetical protein
MCKYSIRLKDSTIINGYIADDCKYKEDTLFQEGNEVFYAMPNKWKMDSIEVLTNIYSYSYISNFPNEDSIYYKRNYYWNLRKISVRNIDSVFFQGQIFESTLTPPFSSLTPHFSNFVFSGKDTVWMSSPIVDSYRIGIFDSIVSNVYICGCNYGFYSHSNSEESNAFMSKVRALDKRLVKYAVNEYAKESNSELEDDHWGFELDDDKIDYMHKQVEELIKKMNGLKIVLILDCFD